MTDPVLYDAEQAAALIPRKTAHWMKVHARRGEIPFTRIGRTYYWTPAHISEIIAAGEQRPVPALTQRTPARKRAAAARTGNRLQAKVPPRKRNASLPGNAKSAPAAAHQGQRRGRFRLAAARKPTW
jgi:hypothetical protein